MYSENLLSTLSSAQLLPLFQADLPRICCISSKYKYRFSFSLPFTKKKEAYFLHPSIHLDFITLYLRDLSYKYIDMDISAIHVNTLDCSYRALPT